MEYFTEYFEDTDNEGAKALMEELGTPKEAARDLMVNLLDCGKWTADHRTRDSDYVVWDFCCLRWLPLFCCFRKMDCRAKKEK